MYLSLCVWGVHMCACKGRRMPGVVLYHSPPYFLETGPLRVSTPPSGQPAITILPYPDPSQHWGCRARSHVQLFCGCEGVELGSSCLYSPYPWCRFPRPSHTLKTNVQLSGTSPDDCTSSQHQGDIFITKTSY